MTREVATSREIATRESADRSDGLYIKQNDWMVQSTSPYGVITIDHIADYFNNLPFSFSFFSKLHGQNATRQLLSIVVKAPVPYHYYFRIYYDFSIFSPTFYFLNSAGGYTISNMNWRREEKTLITFAVDSAGMDMYINKNKTTIGWSGAAAGLGELTDTSYLCLGAWYGIMTGGLIDYSHLQIYDKKLAATDVEARYDRLNSGQSLLGTEAGLVCYFPMQEGSGNLITDIIGAKTGTLTYAEWRQYGGLREAV